MTGLMKDISISASLIENKLSILFASSGAHRWDNGNFVAWLDDCTVASVLQVDIFQIHGEGTAAEHLVLDAWVFLLKCIVEARELEGSREELGLLLREGIGGGEVEDGEVVGGRA
jgi:hypothetical protein